MASGFFDQCVGLLITHPTISRLRFSQDDIQWYGKGADHHDLMQITRANGWMIRADDASSIGYAGVWVHYESCRPGHWCIHCELFPRLSRAAKAAAKNYEELLDLKAEITHQIRELGGEDSWPQRFGAHLKRAKNDPRDPSSLIVWTFDLGLANTSSPNEFVACIVPVIEGTTPLLDEFLVPLST